MRKSPGFWVLISLVALLCFLGYLQYRWIDRLAGAEKERQQQSLRSAVNRIAGAFDVEVTRAMLAFTPMGRPNDGRFERRFDRRDPNGGPPPRGYPGGARPFGPPPMGPPGAYGLESDAFWAERARLWSEFAPYPRLIKEVYVSDGDRTIRVSSSGVSPASGPPGNTSDPVLGAPMGGPDMQIRHRYVVLDGEYIRNELLVSLISRHLDLAHHGVRVESGAEVIFTRGDFIGGETSRFFAFRPECFGGGMRRVRRPPPRDAGASLIARSDVTCDVPIGGFEEGRWTLKAGLERSGAKGFGEFRTRSLLLSFGVLAVLGTGIGVLGLYWHRAQDLAQRQMEFAMAVSHELRTPLTVIRVAADSLAAGMVNEPERYGNLIRRETVRLSDMVEQVLVFARTQRADIRPQFEVVAPGDVIERALSSVSTTLESAGMKVDLAVPDQLPSIRADTNLLSSALQNLLINAAKYGASGGAVSIVAQRVEPGHVSIIVQDNGPGIRAADLSKVFSAFYRAADAANSPVPGLGLGLHLVKRIVDAHGGTVQASNRDGGRGLQVEMRLPAVES